MQNLAVQYIVQMYCISREATSHQPGTRPYFKMGKNNQKTTKKQPKTKQGYPTYFTVKQVRDFQIFRFFFSQPQSSTLTFTLLMAPQAAQKVRNTECLSTTNASLPRSRNLLHQKCPTDYDCAYIRATSNQHPATIATLVAFESLQQPQGDLT